MCKFEGFMCKFEDFKLCVNLHISKTIMCKFPIVDVYLKYILTKHSKLEVQKWFNKNEFIN